MSHCNSRVNSLDLALLQRTIVSPKIFVILSPEVHGPTGTVELQFDAAVTRFSSLAREGHLPERI